MAMIVKKWTGKLFVTLVAAVMAAVAFEYVGIDASAEPPTAVSASGLVAECERFDGGLLLYMDGGADAVLMVSGVGDVPLGYQILADDWTVLDSGEGTFVPLSEWPDAVGVFVFALDGSSIEAATGAGALPAPSPDARAPEGTVPSPASKADSARSAGKSPAPTESVLVAPAPAPAAAARGVPLRDVPDGASGFGGVFTANVVISKPHGDFSIYGLSGGGGTTTVSWPFDFYTDGTYYSNVCEVVVDGGWFTPPATGTYALQVAGDDYVELSIGDLTASASYPNDTPGQVVSGVLVGGISYPVSMKMSSIGGPAGVSCTFSFSEGTNDVWLVLDRQSVRFSPKMGGSPRATATIDGTKKPGSAYKIAYVDKADGIVVDGSGGETAQAYADAGSDSWKGTNRVGKVRFVLLEDGRQVDEGVVSFSAMPEKARKCDCDCGEGTTAANGCVEFSQSFGRTPWIAGLPVGRLAIRETGPAGRLWTPAALVYDHPMCRRVVSRRDASPLDVVTVDPFGEATEYRDGRPAGMSAGLARGVRYNGEGLLVEVLEDRTEITYWPDGSVKSLTPADGEAVPVEGLGIDVLRDAGSGAITSVVSRADGRMDVEALSGTSYRVTWSGPSGAVAKTFTFSGDGVSTFHLHEYRNEQFQFHSEWVYDSSAQDWTFTKAPGTDAARTVAKTISYDGVARAWNATLATLDATGGVVRAESSVLDVSDREIMETSRVVGGRTLYSAERNDTGTVASDVNGTGLQTSYLYDGWNRVTNETAAVRGGILRSTSWTYSDDGASGGVVDRRPRRRVVTENGVTVEDEETIYASNRVTRVRRSGNESRTSFRDLDAQGRTTLSVDEAGHAMRTEYSPADAAFSWTETRDEGVWSEADGFAPVEGKSTRRVTTYDASGNAVAVHDYALAGGGWRETAWTTNRYSASHKVVSSVRSDGKSSSADWICTGPVWTLGEDGIATTNTYDAAKAKVASVRYGRHGAVATAYEYDADGRVVRETDTADGCEARTRLWAYDGEGRVVSETDEHGLVTTYAYSADGRTTTVTLPSGGTRVTTINPDGSLASVTGTAVTPEYHAYGVTADGLRWERVNYLSPDGSRWTKTYRNAFGEVVREERPGANGSTLTTERTYNAKGQLVSTAETGRPTQTRTYDQWGDAASVTLSADGQTRTVAADWHYAVGHDEGIAPYSNEVWRVASRAVSCSDASIVPLVTTNARQVSGLSLSNESHGVSIDVRGNATEAWASFVPATSTRLSYERVPEATNLSLTESVDGVVTLSVSHSAVTNSAAYDAYRRAVVKTDGRGNATTNAYDSLGRLASTTDPTGATTSYAYDAAGNIAAVTNALGVATVYEYDVRGNKTYEGGGTYPVTYAYDAYNVMTNMTTYRSASTGGTGVPPVQGDATAWLYDEATGLLLQKLYADGHGPTYTYTDSGNLATRTWARGVVTYYVYDGWNRLLSCNYSDSTPSVIFVYDAMGRQQAVADAVGVTSFSYDAFGDPTGEAVTGFYSKSMTRHRDAFGRDLGYTLDNSRKNIIEYEADTARMKRVMMAGVWFTYYYLPGTDLKSRLQYGGSGSAYYTYEQSRDLLTQVQNHINGGVISQYDYVNDAAGRRTAITRSGSMMSEARTDHYGYNDRSELVSGTKDTAATNLTEYAYQYDDIGNRISSLDLGTNRTYVANALNQYTNIVEDAGVFLPQFDDDGNQTLVKTSTGIWSVTYNGENRPVLWSCGNTNITMKFDRMGRRVEYIETVGGATNAHHRFVYDGYLCIQRLNGASNNAIDLVFGWDPSEPVATRPLVLQKYGQYNLFYTHDGNKNVSELVFFQQANGIAAHYEYAPFGAVAATMRSTPVSAYDFREYNPFRFSSEYADDVLGLVYYNYRHFDQANGRWLARDLYGINGGYNVMLYCNNKPLSNVDILGLRGNDPPIALVGYATLVEDTCEVTEATSICEPSGKNFEVYDETPIRIDFVMKDGSAEGWGYSNFQLSPHGPSGIPIGKISGWVNYEERRNKGLRNGLLARKKYTCTIKFKACCKIDDKSSYTYEGETSYSDYVYGNTFMAIDNELGRLFSNTPAQYRYMNATFAANPGQEKIFKDNCAKKAKNLKYVNSYHYDYNQVRDVRAIY